MANYKESGVDVEEGYRAVNKYKDHAKRTAIPGLLTGLGSFNGMFEIPKGYKNPVMVSGTDGVGTKLDVAFQMKKYDTVGIDCVAMSVNDILCSGVQPLFFLDYVACGKLDADVAADLVKGVADGCVDTRVLQTVVLILDVLFLLVKLLRCLASMMLENMTLPALVLV